MTMLWTLLQKDFRRTVRNPWPTVLNLALPLAITALFALAFGGGGKNGSSLARIKVAVVDQDGQMLGSIFKSALAQGDGAKHFEILTPGEDEALDLLRNSEISAAVIIPEHFTKEYLAGQSGLELRVIKNPAQSFYPAIVEELASVAVTGLSAVSRNLQSEFPAIRTAVTNKFDFLELAAIFTRLGNRVKEARAYLSPPLVTYTKEIVTRDQPEPAGGMNLFAFILPGMASAFLLFLADHAMRDIHREQRLKTLDRIRGVTTGVFAFIASKVLFAAFTVLMGAAILFLFGDFIFGIHWQRPGLMALVCLAYSVFAAGFLAMLVAVAPSEKRSETLNNILLFLFAFAGGSYFPANQLPAFMREHICPLIPNYWFIEAIRGLQSAEASGPRSAWVVAELALAGAVLAVAAGVLLHKRLTRGARV